MPRIKTEAPGIVYALLKDWHIPQVVELAAVDPPDEVLRWLKNYDGDRNFTHYGGIRDEQGRVWHTMVTLHGCEICFETSVLFNEDGLWSSSGGGGRPIQDWVTDLSGVNYRWAQWFEDHIKQARRDRIRAGRRLVELKRSLEEFTEEIPR